jgi:DNA-binding protein HU-beta
MKKLDWLKEVAHKTELPLTVITKVFDEFKEVFIEALKTDGEIAWAGVVNLKVKHVAAKKGRNPKTGEVINIAAKNKVVAKVGKHLSDAVN